MVVTFVGICFIAMTAPNMHLMNYNGNREPGLGSTYFVEYVTKDRRYPFPNCSSRQLNELSILLCQK